MLFGKRERIIRRILIVEDEPLVAFDNEYLLSEEGYEVVATVDSVADALGVIDKEPLDLVLSDIKLSGAGDGIDVARAAGTKDIPVLRSEEHTSELQSLMRISYAVFCLKKKKKKTPRITKTQTTKTSKSKTTRKIEQT